ncbi:MAG: winged helix-turn-helix transcriptional regulator [Actinomycetota bacterium]|nr:winged helix-turn-helix transcriptional regulator [Actinomycetota bacterium]
MVRDLAAGPRRFVELQRVLPGISTEQLRSRLNRMVADGMLTRKRYREVPPRVDYELTDRARDLMPVLGQLARWGYEWAWSVPRDAEAIDLGAIFRLAPGLIPSGNSSSGVVEFVVEEPRVEPSSFTFTIGEHGVAIEEAGSGSPDARVTGAKSAWISAFSPDRDRSGLLISGKDRLAQHLLDALRGADAGNASASRRSTVHAA